MLCLFSGTKSFSKVFEKKGWKCYTLDMDGFFEPTFNVDILKWNYQEDLKDIHIDYLHSSPVCKEFTQLKNGKNQTRDLKLGVSLVDKTIEILKYLQHRNPRLLFTIENPRSKDMRQIMSKYIYNRSTCSYCMYNFKYNKPSDFWNNIGLKLKMCSRRKKKEGFPDGCDGMRNNKGIHKVRIGYRGSYKKDGTKQFYDDLQIIDSKYFKELKKQEEFKGYNDTYLRYRIPSGLIDDIYNQVMKEMELQDIRLVQSIIKKFQTPIPLD